jgi:hypothetical protein
MFVGCVLLLLTIASWSLAPAISQNSRDVCGEFGVAKSGTGEDFVKWIKGSLVVATIFAALVLPASPNASAQENKPNILVIMGDDIGWFNLGSYNSGIMLGATPEALAFGRDFFI